MKQIMQLILTSDSTWLINPTDLSNIIGTKLGNNVFVHTEQHFIHKQPTDINDTIHDTRKYSKYNTQFSLKRDNSPTGNRKNFVKSYPPFPDSKGKVKLQ